MGHRAKHTRKPSGTNKSPGRAGMWIAVVLLLAAAALAGGRLFAGRPDRTQEELPSPPEETISPTPDMSAGPDQSAPWATQPPATQDPAEKSISGLVYECTPETLVLETGSGFYAVPTGGEDWQSLVGREVTLLYEGQWDDGALWQTVQIQQVLSPSETGLDQPAAAGQAAETNTIYTQARLARAWEILQGMTLEEKVGQLFLIRCPLGDAAAQAARDYAPGGFLLFGENTQGQDRESLREWIASVQEASRLPALFAVDEEGGEVCRLSRYPAFRDEPFPSPMTLFRQGGWEAVEQDTMEKCDLLNFLGIHVNMAPVCDVCSVPEAFMYSRSLGGDAVLTSRYAARVAAGYASRGVGCVLKHFPGYGDNLDTHTGMAVDSRTLDQLESRDLLPFQAGIQAGAEAILVSHMVVSCLDGAAPASLSPAVHAYIRDALGFDGVVITDDLYMDAITEYAGLEAAAVLAVQAGNDLICCTDYVQQIPAVIQAVNQGEISLERVEQSVLRILCWKLELGVIV